MKEVHQGTSSADMREEPSQHCADSSVVKKQEVEDKVTAGRCASDFDIPTNPDKILPDVKPTMIDRRKETLNFDCSIQSSQSTDVPGRTMTTSSSISEVVNILAMDVRNQLAVSSAALTSIDCSTPVFNELEQSLRTSPSELRGMQLIVPSLQPAFIKVELVKVCKVKEGQFTCTVPLYHKFVTLTSPLASFRKCSRLSISRRPVHNEECCFHGNHCGSPLPHKRGISKEDTGGGD